MAELRCRWCREASALFFQQQGCSHGHPFRIFRANSGYHLSHQNCMIRKLKTGEFRLYSRKKDPKTGKARNLGTFKTREAAEQHEREVQFFKRK